MMALKDGPFGNPCLRFYSPSIDSPLIPDWNDWGGSFAGRTPKTKYVDIAILSLYE
jgi:hypothetical protein